LKLVAKEEPVEVRLTKTFEPYQELGVLRNHRDDQTVKVNELCTRARSGVRAFFGPDSSEYELVGGTRTSERKKPQRKPAETPTK
jgi:hypothetical protein